MSISCVQTITTARDDDDSGHLEDAARQSPENTSGATSFSDVLSDLMNNKTTTGSRNNDHVPFRRGVSRGRAHVLRLLKLVGVVSVPVLSLVVVCAVQFVRAVADDRSVQRGVVTINEFSLLDRLIGGLQLERGVSAAYLTSAGTNVKALERLRSVVWPQNDDVVRALTDWPTGGLTSSVLLKIRYVQ